VPDGITDLPGRLPFVARDDLDGSEDVVVEVFEFLGRDPVLKQLPAAGACTS